MSSLLIVLLSHPLRNLIPTLEYLVAIAFDEAHKVAEWGQSMDKRHGPFRIAFASAGHSSRAILKRQVYVSGLTCVLLLSVQQVPYVALTASVTVQSKKDIIKLLAMKQFHFIQGSSERLNIRIVVRTVPPTEQYENVPSLRNFVADARSRLGLAPAPTSPELTPAP